MPAVALKNPSTSRTPSRKQMVALRYHPKRLTVVPSYDLFLVRLGDGRPADDEAGRLGPSCSSTNC